VWPFESGHRFGNGIGRDTCIRLLARFGGKLGRALFCEGGVPLAFEGREDGVPAVALGADIADVENTLIGAALDGQVRPLECGDHGIVPGLLVHLVLVIEEYGGAVVLLGEGDEFLGQIIKSRRGDDLERDVACVQRFRKLSQVAEYEVDAHGAPVMLGPLLRGNREHRHDAFAGGPAGPMQGRVVLDAQVRSKPHQSAHALSRSFQDGRMFSSMRISRARCRMASRSSRSKRSTFLSIMPIRRLSRNRAS
jgi:hypothetical protein